MSEIHKPYAEVFAFPLYISLIPVVVAAALLALGILCYRKREARRLSYLMFAGVLIAGGIFAPAMLQDRIVVSSKEITTTTGFWFSPTREGFVYRDVRYVRVTKCRDPKGRVCPAWDVHFQDGRLHQIPLSDLWSRHSESIVALLESHGVVFSR